MENSQKNDEIDADSYPESTELIEKSPPAKTPKLEGKSSTYGADKSGRPDITVDSVKKNSSSNFMETVDSSSKIEKINIADNLFQEAHHHSSFEIAEPVVAATAGSKIADQNAEVDGENASAGVEGLKIDIEVAKDMEKIEESRLPQSPVGTGATNKHDVHFILALCTVMI